jgi:hypothetical protein
MSIIALVTLLVQAGVELAPLIQKLIAYQSEIDKPGRADVSDQQRKLTRELIVALQKKINEA